MGEKQKTSPHEAGDVHRYRGQIDHRFVRLLAFSLVQTPAMPPFAFPELPFDRIPSSRIHSRPLLLFFGLFSFERASSIPL